MLLIEGVHSSVEGRSGQRHRRNKLNFSSFSDTCIGCDLIISKQAAICAFRKKVKGELSLIGGVLSSLPVSSRLLGCFPLSLPLY